MAVILSICFLTVCNIACSTSFMLIMLNISSLYRFEFFIISFIIGREHEYVIVMIIVYASGAIAFDMDYARWVDEHQRMINDIRSAINSQMGDNELHLLVDGVMTHYDELFRLKNIGAKADVFHILSGMWKTPAERCFIWLGGFRSSELLKVINHFIFCFSIYSVQCS